MKKSEISSYFVNGKAVCQSCGREIRWNDRAVQRGSETHNQNMNYWWKAYSRNGWQLDPEYQILCKRCYVKAMDTYGPEISREGMLKLMNVFMRQKIGLK